MVVPGAVCIGCWDLANFAYPHLCGSLPFETQVKNKMWFGMNKAFAALIDEWTVQEVAGNAMLRVEASSCHGLSR